jgi:opine dehydrogenase
MELFGLVPWASLGNAVGISTPVMDALIEFGGTIKGVNPWEIGRNLKKMGLEGLASDLHLPGVRGAIIEILAG